MVLDATRPVGAATQAAGKIADVVLIPVTASGVDLVATAAAVELIRQARTLRRGGAPKCLIVPSKIDRRTDAGRRIDEQLRSFGETVGPAMHQRTAYVEAFGTGQWIGDYAPQSPAHFDISSLAIAVKRSLQNMMSTTHAARKRPASRPDTLFPRSPLSRKGRPSRRNLLASP